ncbi:MAG: hypothetical protein GY854_22690 [Deltaproteobacteria bacterium]|nr:hypothetical protein [Deltaproteobacteria bacterium]
MKRMILIALVVVVGLAMSVASCMDREPAPVCPVPTEVSSNQSLVSGFDGVDLLVVVDNSGSMAEEQAILSTGFFTLVNSLMNPISGPDWPYPEVENMRVALVSSDIGLQYGEDRSTEGFPYGDTKVPTCTDQDAPGDDGKFQTSMKGTVTVTNNQINCSEDGQQCPEDWSCTTEGKCVSPSGDDEAVNCTQLGGGNWAQTEEEEKNTNLATQVACMSQLGTGGCGVEQQLEAAVRGLSRNNDQKAFMKASHLLAVLIVSDEEDCSIEDKGLFGTDQWKSGTLPNDSDSSRGLLNTACNLPAENEDNFLFGTNRYWNELVALKDNQPRAVIFAAIVGVPTGDSSPCQGRGSELGGCLAHNDMKLEIGLFTNEAGNEFKHFKSACQRDDADGNLVTSARPGRRYVEVAEEFGANGYVYSICNEDWSLAMKDIAKVIAENIGNQCYPKSLEWSPVKGACDGCGQAKCDVVVTFEYNANEGQRCPAEFNVDPNKVVEEYEKDKSGSVTKYFLRCPLPKLSAEIDCAQARARYPGDTKEIGWFYCEDQTEDFDEICHDEIDNDGVDGADCQDPKCAECCTDDLVGCRTSCKYGVELTKAAKNASRGNMVSVECLTQFSFQDENCQENTNASCADGIDNDGNGVWDCKSEKGHFADPHCCPMTVVEEVVNGEKTSVCKIKTAETRANCGGGDTLPDACHRAALLHKCSI